MMKKINILLVGCGRFGRNHLRVLKELEKEETIQLKGIVVKSDESKKKIEKEYPSLVYTALTDSLLKNIDAVDIVTPASTHVELIKKCLPYCHILVEKPLALSAAEIEELQQLEKRYHKKIMVGHIFRFNAAVKELKKRINENGALKEISGFFISSGEAPYDCGALHDELHLFDILDFILEENPTKGNMKILKKTKQDFEELAIIRLKYPSVPNVTLMLGWRKEEKERSLKISYDDKILLCDLLTQTIKEKSEIREVETSYFVEEPLKEEIKAFINVIHGNIEQFPDTNTALRIQKVIDIIKENEN